MAVVAAIGAKPSGGPQANPARIVRLWRDDVRVEQLARLRGMQLQKCDEVGEFMWKAALRRAAQLPEGMRVDVPSLRVFSSVIGLYRSAAILKKSPMVRLELSADDIASLVGYARSTVEACLRWLGCEDIKVAGEKVCQALGYLHRGRRTARAYLDGKLRRVYRTSRTILHTAARGLLGLCIETPDDRRRRAARASGAMRPKVKAAAPPIEQEPFEYADPAVARKAAADFWRKHAGRPQV